jgi:hypothetical protein
VTSDPQAQSLEWWQWSRKPRSTAGHDALRGAASRSDFGPQERFPAQETATKEHGLGRLHWNRRNAPPRGSTGSHPRAVSRQREPTKPTSPLTNSLDPLVWVPLFLRVPRAGILPSPPSR